VAAGLHGTVAEDIGAIGQAEGELGILLQQQEGDLPSKLLQGPHNHLDYLGRQALQGLIPEHQVGVPHQASPDAKHLALAPAEPIAA
jgi:hypothetical protein